MIEFNVPTREDVSEGNKQIFDRLNSMLGFVPNLYAFYAKNETALNDYLTLQNRKSTLRAKEREVINLVVSQINNCEYCLAAHSTIGKMSGLKEDEIIDIRRGTVAFDEKIAALAEFVRETTQNRGRPSDEAKRNFFDAGYTEANLIDVLIVIGDKTISNYLHSVTQIPIDWEPAPSISIASST